MHAALPMNSLSPRLAEFDSAECSPAMYRSIGALRLTSRRSNAASDLPVLARMPLTWSRSAEVISSHGPSAAVLLDLGRPLAGNRAASGAVGSSAESSGVGNSAL